MCKISVTAISRTYTTEALIFHLIVIPMISHSHLFYNRFVHINLDTNPIKSSYSDVVIIKHIQYRKMYPNHCLINLSRWGKQTLMSNIARLSNDKKNHPVTTIHDNVTIILKIKFDHGETIANIHDFKTSWILFFEEKTSWILTRDLQLVQPSRIPQDIQRPCHQCTS